MEKVETLRPSKTKKTAQTPMKNLNLTTSNPNKQKIKNQENNLRTETEQNVLSPRCILQHDTPTPDFLVRFSDLSMLLGEGWSISKSNLHQMPRKEVEDCPEGGVGWEHGRRLEKVAGGVFPIS